MLVQQLVILSNITVVEIGYPKIEKNEKQKREIK